MVLVAVVSVGVAPAFNQIVMDVQREPGTARTLNCRDPSPFWATFERCEGQEHHLFWVAGLTALAAGGFAALLQVNLERLVTSTSIMRRASGAWVAAAAALGFVGVLAWAFVAEIG